LEKKLGKNRRITSDEKERRLRSLEGLASKKIQLDSRFQNTPASSSRNQLLETAQRTKLFDDDDDDDQPIIDANTSVETFRGEQQQIIRQQDDSLDALSKVISRQKHIAIRIGNEVENQNEILDDLATQMENTGSRVNSSTRNAEDVVDKDSTFGYWIVIISLFVAIVIIGIL
jgi:syntaxin 8